MSESQNSPPHPPSRATLLCAGLWILLASVVLRVIFIHFADWQPIADTRDYHVLAYNLAHGSGYMQDYQGETRMFQGQTFYAYRSPGYPALLAAWYSIFGWIPQRAMWLNLLAELITSVCVFWIALRLTTPRTALLAMGLWGLQALWTTSLMSESVFTAGFMLLILLLMFADPLASAPKSLATGVLLAATLFIRPIAVCIAAAAAVRQTLNRWTLRRAAWFALLLLPAFAAMAAWGCRNERVLGAFVPLSTNFGRHNAPSFGIAVEPVYLDMRARGANEAEINHELTHRLVAQVAAHPGQALAIYARRMVDLFSLPSLERVSEGLLWNGRFPTDQTPAWVYPFFRALYFQNPFVYVCAAIGILTRLAQRRGTQGLGLTCLMFVLIHGLVSPGNIRFAAPLYPALCIFAAMGLANTSAWVRQHVGRASSQVQKVSKPLRIRI